MPATLPRCRRCGTVIRNNRTVCPGCGTSLSELVQEPAPEPEQPETAVAEPPPAAPKKTLCQACMQSVPVDAIVDYKGSRICQQCADVLKGRLTKPNP
jgi:hypothetical protein